MRCGHPDGDTLSDMTHPSSMATLSMLENTEPVMPRGGYVYGYLLRYHLEYYHLVLLHPLLPLSVLLRINGSPDTIGMMVMWDLLLGCPHLHQPNGNRRSMMCRSTVSGSSGSRVLHVSTVLRLVE